MTAPRHYPDSAPARLAVDIPRARAVLEAGLAGGHRCAYDVAVALARGPLGAELHQVLLTPAGVLS